MAEKAEKRKAVVAAVPHDHTDSAGESQLGVVESSSCAESGGGAGEKDSSRIRYIRTGQERKLKLSRTQKMEKTSGAGGFGSFAGRIPLSRSQVSSFARWGRRLQFAPVLVHEFSCCEFPPRISTNCCSPSPAHRNSTTVVCGGPPRDALGRAWITVVAVIEGSLDVLKEHPAT